MTTVTPEAAGTLTITTLRLQSPPPADVQAAHAAIAAAAEGPRVLWAHPAPTLLVVQAERVHLARFSWPVASCTSWPASRPDLMWAGKAVTFALIANPTTAVGKRRPDGTASARPGRRPLPLDQRGAWLRRKLAGALTITSLQDRALPTATGRRGEHRVRVARHLFTGHARVTDPGQLAGLAVGGVGAAKGYGCGLLIIREEA